MGVGNESIPLPQEFGRILGELTEHVWRPEILIEEIPAPQRIAPFSAAITADVVSDDIDLGNGRLVLLHDPAGNESWGGTFRCVSFARAEVEREMVTDPMLAEVGWSWLIDSLTAHDAEFVEPSGTVTAVSSESFGGMAGEQPRAELEIRASWTPVFDHGAGLHAHLSAWDHLLCTLAGLPPLPSGVVMIPTARRRRAR